MAALGELQSIGIEPLLLKDGGMLLLAPNSGSETCDTAPWLLWESR